MARYVFPFCLFFNVIILLACKSTNKNEPSPNISDGSDTSAMSAHQMNSENCYLFIAAKDTYALKLNQNHDGKITGSAVYKNYEKDSSHGSVEGEQQGDTLHIWYRFESEGMQSVRELYFQKKDDTFITGIAEESVTGDSAYVRDKQTIRFSGPIYKRLECAIFPAL